MQRWLRYKSQGLRQSSAINCYDHFIEKPVCSSRPIVIKIIGIVFNFEIRLFDTILLHKKSYYNMNMYIDTFYYRKKNFNVVNISIPKN